MSRRKVAELDTPFSSVEWPSVPQDEQDAILELLCALLAPLGQHRRNHATPSKGKRARRRQKKTKDGPGGGTDSKSTEASLSGAVGGSSHRTETRVMAAPLSETPPPPPLARFVDVGLTTISRTLASAAPASLTSPGSLEPPPKPPYTAVFVVRSGHPSAFYSHFPQMVAVASSRGKTAISRSARKGQGDGSDPAPVSVSVSAMPTPRPIRLIGFSRSCEERLATCVGVPRVSCIALRPDAPRAETLLALLDEKVPAVSVPWLDEARQGRFRATQIRVSEVPVGPKKRKRE